MLDKMLTALILVGALFSTTLGLIGLRPPNKDPRHTKETFHHHDPANQTMQQKSNDSQSLKTDPHSQCHVFPLLRCGFRFIRQTLRNEVSPCEQVKTFSKCSMDSLREVGRRDFVMGLSLLNDLSFHNDNIYSCGSNSSGLLPVHTRHQRTKRSYSNSGHASSCCSDIIVNCSVQTYLKMSINPADKCGLVDFFHTCLSDVVVTCAQDSMTNTISLFTAQLKQVCVSESNQRRRKRYVTN